MKVVRVGQGIVPPAAGTPALLHKKNSKRPFLVLPAAAYHVVQEGQTLTEVAHIYGVTNDDIKAANILEGFNDANRADLKFKAELLRSELIYPGQQLFIPVKPEANQLTIQLLATQSQVTYTVTHNPVPVTFAVGLVALAMLFVTKYKAKVLQMVQPSDPLNTLTPPEVLIADAQAEISKVQEELASLLNAAVREQKVAAMATAFPAVATPPTSATATLPSTHPSPPPLPIPKPLPTPRPSTSTTTTPSQTVPSTPSTTRAHPTTRFPSTTSSPTSSSSNTAPYIPSPQAPSSASSLVPAGPSTSTPSSVVSVGSSTSTPSSYLPAGSSTSAAKPSTAGSAAITQASLISNQVSTAHVLPVAESVMKQAESLLSVFGISTSGKAISAPAPSKIDTPEAARARVDAVLEQVNAQIASLPGAIPTPATATPTLPATPSSASTAAAAVAATNKLPATPIAPAATAKPGAAAASTFLPPSSTAASTFLPPSTAPPYSAVSTTSASQAAFTPTAATASAFSFPTTATANSSSPATAASSTLATAATAGGGELQASSMLELMNKDGISDRINQILTLLDNYDATDNQASPSAPAASPATGSPSPSPPANATSGGPPVKSLMSLKSDVLDLVYGTSRGLDASQEEKGLIEDRITVLESNNPNMLPKPSVDLLSGRWRLVYTSNTRTLMLLNTLRSLPLVDVKDAYQIIDARSRIVHNKIDLSVPMPSMPMSLGAEAGLELRSHRQFKMRVRRLGIQTVIQTPQLLASLQVPETIKVLGANIDTTPLKSLLQPVNSGFGSARSFVSGLVSPQIDVAGADSDDNTLWMVNTYVDDDMRITRDDIGAVYVMMRDVVYGSSGLVM